MNLSAPFIQRPIATSLIALGLAFSGIVAFNCLGVAPLPQVDYPTISVQASLPGASPEIMATSVATPLERQFGRIAGITEMTSASSLGSTRVTIQFDLTRNIDGAARDVQAAINAAKAQLPTNLPGNPTYRKVNPSDAPIMIIALTSPTYTNGQLYDAASTILQQKLSQVDGIGQVMVGGSSLPAIRIELNPTLLNKYGISLNDVSNTIALNNTTSPKGQITYNHQTYNIMTNDQLFKPEEYVPLIINYQNGTALKLSDVADITESVQDLRNAGFSDGKPSVLLVLFKQPGANVITTVDKVKKLLPTLKASLPEAIDLTVGMDRTTTIRASLRDVERTLIISIFLVIGVVFVFLGNARAASIPSITVPLSLLGTFGIMYLLNFSLDNLSLMALTIATGFVVDDAVVVLENTERHIEEGLHPLKAAYLGAQEVGFTVVSMSISLIAVFIPILLMGGIIGRLFREFAITLSAAILVSLFISLTITPMMCSKFLRPIIPQLQTSYLNKLVKQFQLYYRASLLWALDHQRLMLGATVSALMLSVILFWITPKGFFPQQDTGRITGSVQTDQDMSFQTMRIKLLDFIKIIESDPAIQHVVGFVGSGNTGSLFISLKPLNKTKTSATDVINRLRPKLAKISGATMYLQAAQDLLIGGRLGNAQFQYTISADTLETLNQWAPTIMRRIAKIPGLADVNSDQRDQGLQVVVKINHDTAAKLGITTKQIDSTLYNAFGQFQVSTIYTAMNQYYVIMEVAPQYWQNPDQLNNIYIPTNTQTLVPLSTIASFIPSSTLLAVNHQGQFPSATISFNLLPNTSLGTAVDNINRVMEELHLPPDIHGTFQGTARAFQASLATEPYLILTALLAVYIVLGMLYESLVHPITILSTLPSAGVGALIALLITSTELTIIALIGIILLVGIVKKNAIMMIDFALQAERTKQKSPRDAILEAAQLRFRPIMMTTCAALFSAIPLAIGMGVGSELRKPLGIAIIGGLLLSQLLTLYTTPVIYLKLGQSGKWLKEQWKRFKELFILTIVKGIDV